MLNPTQSRMARHALGLDDEIPRRSYRNRYSAGVGSTAATEWLDMVKKKVAGQEKRNPGSATIGFWLTKAGAQAVLRKGESLDPEDFST